MIFRTRSLMDKFKIGKLDDFIKFLHVLTIIHIWILKFRSPEFTKNRSITTFTVCTPFAAALLQLTSLHGRTLFAEVSIQQKANF